MRTMPRRRRIARALTLSLAIGAVAFSALSATAQVAPNAGSLQRQLRQGVPEAVPQRPPAAPEAPRIEPETGSRLLVKGFVIDGATLIPEAELERLLKDRVGKEQSLRDLQDAARTIADAYRERGYFARAFLPAQDVAGGIVHIRVIEGRFGRVIRRDGATRANGAFIEDMVGSRLKPGEPYSMAALERGLLLANDLPGVAADGTLKAGAAPGTSDLALAIHDTPIVTGTVGADDAGTGATGLYRGDTGLSVNDWTGYGDQLTFRGIASARLSYGQAGWSAPLGTNGWQAGVSATALRYRLGGSFKDLDGHGIALTQGANLSYALIRGSTETLRVRFSYEHGRYDDDLLDAAFHRKRVNKVGVGLVGDWSDGLGGGGLTSYRVTLTSGALDLSRLGVDQALDADTARSNGHFAKIAFDFQRDQALATDLFLRGRAAGQWSGKNLDSSEQFALGGLGGVRAYPTNEGLGDSGLVANLELHRPFTTGWASGLDLFGFFDAGLIRQHAHAWDGWNADGDNPNSYPLFGAGIGATYAVAGNFGVSLTAAVPVGANQGSSVAGHNQDGSRTDPWVWVSVTKTF